MTTNVLHCCVCCWGPQDVQLTPFPSSHTAVQEERQRVKEKGEGEVESTTCANSEMPVERVLEAELTVDPKTDTYLDAQKDAVTNICQAADKQLFTLVDWAKRIPHFTEMPLEDQVILLRAGTAPAVDTHTVH